MRYVAGSMDTPSSPSIGSGEGSVGLSDFAHLHLHSQYSLLDGAIRTKDLCKTVKERGMHTVAVTDHGNMFGAVQFYEEAKKWGVKPILGCEAYIADSTMETRKDRKNYHIVLLAKNNIGFANLQRLVSFGYLRGFYYNPRIDRAVLREHSEGLIGLSACVSGHISRLLLAGKMDEAKATVLEYKSIFEPGCYFLELQPNRLENQEKINPLLAQLAADCGVPIVATNDCHYVNRDEAHAHEILMCMGQGRTLDDPKRMKHECDEFFIKRPEEMAPYFSQYPAAMENAARIAAMCNVELSLGTPELPDFELPPGTQTDLPGYLREVVEQGLNERFAELRARGFRPDEDRYRSRLDHELNVINSMKFPGYFLIVWDFIRHAKKIGVPVGPGRGSGAGSLVAYSMRITDLDPMQYNLLFERFLNPDRVSMPDFDIDFCMDRREEVISYVMDRYGHDHVGQIATFHSLKARGLVRDVCRVMGWSVSETNDLAKLIPEGPKVTLSGTMLDPVAMKKEIKADPSKEKQYKDVLPIAEASEKLRRRVADDTNAAKVMKVGTSLEGLNRHAGMHAAGVVIGNRPLWEHVPCFRADGKIVTQYTMVDAEKAGLVKFDFLGLKTLTVISNAVRLVNEVELQGLAPWPPIQHPVDRTDEHPPVPHGPDKPAFDIDAIPLDDPDVYAMISRGDTTGVFQLESSGFKELLTRLKPDRFEDIIAAVALYRPGPLEGGMVDQFIECKHGRRKIEYPHDLLEDVLRETYGVFVYQEQVMQAAQILAGFSLGAADIMRRAMGKKKKAEMDRQRALFVEGCKANNQIEEKTSNEIFDLIDKFAGYGFNKSHSAAYGLITYQTGYLKCHFRTAFMAALMTCDKDKNENVVKFIAEARSSGIGVLPPCVNESDRDFTVVTRKNEETGNTEQLIRFGMGAVRNVGANAVDSILQARKQDGGFVSVFEMCRRVDIKKVNKRTLEGLLRSGGLDDVACGHGRSQLLGAIDSAVEQGQGAQRDRESGQVGLFAAIAEPDSVFVEAYPNVEEWSPKERLLGEREALGFYLTGHPLDRFQQDVERFATAHVGKLRRDMDGNEVVIAGVICEFREIQTRSGKGPMCFFQLEDQYGRVEVIVFPKTYQRVDEETGQTLADELERAAEEPVLVSGRIEVERSDEGDIKRFKLLADSVRLVADVRSERTQNVLLRLRSDQLTDEKVLALKQLVSDHSGPCTMELQVTVDGRFASRIVFGDEFGVTADESLMLALERMFGPDAARMR